MRRAPLWLALLFMLALLAATAGRPLHGAPAPLPVYLVVLAEQPLPDLAPAVEAPFRAELDRLSAALADDARAWEPAERAALQAQADATLSALRLTLLEQAAPALDRSQRPVLAAIEAAGGQLVYRYRVANVLAARLPAEAVDLLAQRPDVAAVLPDQLIQANLNVSAPTTGAPTWWAAGRTGGVWDLAVVDTGLGSGSDSGPARFHPAFTGHTVVAQRFLDAAGALASLDLFTDDVNGHGTNVAGIASSVDPTYRGVGYGHDKLYNLKAGYDPDGAPGGGASMYWSDAMAAVDWSLTVDDLPDVYNLSFGSCTSAGDTNFSRFWDALVDDFAVGVAIAAGNNRLTCTPEIHEPSIAYNVLSVANADDRGTLARSDDIIYYNSSRGPTADGRRKPDITAPGAAISSANNLWEEGGGLWTAYWGTSQAAPHVAGALLLALDGGLFYPHLQKAVLINSAEDRGPAGWDAEWGWGYLDLARAYATRTFVVDRWIQPNPDYDLYRLSLVAGDKATLVWNRHVDYAGAAYPPAGNVHALSDLDLYLYNHATNVLVGSSLSPIDNVEQVRVSSSLTGVLRVQPASIAFDGFLYERYALAASGALTSVTGPRLAAGPDQAHHLAVGDTVEVIVPVTNSGDLTLHAVSATFSVPAGFTLLEGTLPTALGNLAAGGGTSARWVLQKTAESVIRTMTVTITGSGYGLSFSDQVAVHLIKPPDFWLPLLAR